VVDSEAALDEARVAGRWAPLLRRIGVAGFE
jgi:hypothetical protein